MTTNDGGPAFPLPPVGTGDPRDGMAGGSQGMSLRDWFAGQANENDILEYLPPTVGEVAKFEKEHGFHPTRQWARYRHADAMLAARGGAK